MREVFGVSPPLSGEWRDARVGRRPGDARGGHGEPQRIGGHRRESHRVADFENQAGDSTLAWTVVQALRIDLARSPRLALPSAQQVRDGLAAMRADTTAPLTAERALALARRSGAKAVLDGAVGGAGTSVPSAHST